MPRIIISPRHGLEKKRDKLVPVDWPDCRRSWVNNHLTRGNAERSIKSRARRLPEWLVRLASIEKTKVSWKRRFPTNPFHPSASDSRDCTFLSFSFRPWKILESWSTNLSHFVLCEIHEGFFVTSKALLVEEPARRFKDAAYWSRKTRASISDTGQSVDVHFVLSI